MPVSKLPSIASRVIPPYWDTDTSASMVPLLAAKERSVVSSFEQVTAAMKLHEKRVCTGLPIYVRKRKKSVSFVSSKRAILSEIVLVFIEPLLAHASRFLLPVSGEYTSTAA